MRDFFDTLTDEELAEVVAAMKDVTAEGLATAKHLRGDLYEVKADAATRSFRVLFSAEGRFSQVLLSLSALTKKTQRTPKHELDLAESRLNECRARGKRKKSKVLLRRRNAMARDFLDEIVAARTARNSRFRRLVEEAEFRRKAARQLAAQREKLELSQTVVAAMMGTSASVVSKLESAADVKISTLMRYCQAVGKPWSFVPVRKAAAR